MSTTTRAPAFLPAETARFTAAWLHGEAAEWLPRLPSREADWAARIAEAAALPPARDVWVRAARDAQRLGGNDASRRNAEALAAGEALCVTTGQQPGLLLGPLYTAYKIMTTVALAADLGARGPRTVVPVFWNAADDSDFTEIASSCMAVQGLALSARSLDGGDLPAGTPVGDLGVDGTRRVVDGLRADLARQPGGAAVLRSLDQALERAADHGELTTALLLDLFRGSGLVVVDARWAELRRAAAPLWRRWASLREESARSIVEVGQALERAGFRAQLQEASTRNGLFDVTSGRRLPFAGTTEELLERIDTSPETLAPNVTLRPLAQDSLFPSIATVGGPSEITYHAQLSGEYRLLGVPLPVLFPRFAATLVPRGVFELAAHRREPAAAFVEDFDGALRATGERSVPDALRRAIESLERSLADGLERVGREAEAFDAKLAGSVPDVGRRVAEAIGRLREKTAAAARAAEARRDPALNLYREFLRPRGIAQERVLGALTLFLESTTHPLEGRREALARHLESVRRGELRHWLLELEGEGGRA